MIFFKMCAKIKKRINVKKTRAINTTNDSDVEDTSNWINTIKKWILYNEPNRAELEMKKRKQFSYEPIVILSD
ncbi:MAG: hypothetical protein H6Q67_2083 [Firmicutes bacterium]|nr:hypothetical protein [Bacillota bacterium]